MALFDSMLYQDFYVYFIMSVLSLCGFIISSIAASSLVLFFSSYSLDYGEPLSIFHTFMSNAPILKSNYLQA